MAESPQNLINDKDSAIEITINILTVAAVHDYKLFYSNIPGNILARLKKKHM